MVGRYVFRVGRLTAVVILGVSCGTVLALIVGNTVDRLRPGGEGMEPGRWVSWGILFVVVAVVMVSSYVLAVEPGKYPGGRIAVLDADGVLLNGPPVRFAWSEVGEIVLLRLIRSGDGETDTEKHYLVVVGRSADVERPPDPRRWGPYRELWSAARPATVTEVVGLHAPHVTVRAVGPVAGVNALDPMPEPPSGHL